MRMLDKLKLPYKVHLYECDEFIDGVHIAELLGESCDSCFKTLVTVGKSGNYYVFALPVDKELDMKSAPAQSARNRLKWCMSRISTP